MSRTWLAGCAILARSAIGWADPIDAAALHSSVGWGTTVVPDRLALATQAGYDGGTARAEAVGTIEALIAPRLGVFTAIAYGEEVANASRPALGLGFQITDPRATSLGARVSVAYKPEGFSEPEGEVETIAMISHLIERDVARSFVAYGRDSDGHESDVEVGAGYLHRVADHLIVGATTRYRYAIAMKVPGPRWDLVGGAVGDLLLDRWRLEVLVGGDANRTIGVAAGLLGLVSVGVDL